MKHPAADMYLNNLLPHLDALFKTLIEEGKREYTSEGVARVYIDHPNLEKAIIVPPTYLGELTSETIMGQVDNVLYSAGEIPADDFLNINFAVVNLVRGNGKYKMMNVMKDVKRKRSCIQIPQGHECLPRSILVGVSRLHRFAHPNNKDFKTKYDSYRKPASKAVVKEAIKLRASLGIPNDRSGLLTDVPKYEEKLGVSICVISSSFGNKRVYNGSEKYSDRIFLMHYGSDGGHFETVGKINGMMKDSYYCDHCGKGFKTKTSHKCKVYCNICGRNNCLDSITARRCVDCNQVCRSDQCYNEHIKKQTEGRGVNKGVTHPSLCERSWKCLDCGVLLRKNERNPSFHECGESQCSVCHQYHVEKHLCYMRSMSPKDDSKKFIFYDFECQQKDGKHVPNLVVAHSICEKCEDDPVTSEATCSNCGSRCVQCDIYNKKEKDWERELCEGCGKREIIFSGCSTADEFCIWLISQQHKNVTAIAHNARAYDAYFLYEYLMKNNHIPNPIFSGSKIMYMHLPSVNIRLLDSLNFLPMPLCKLPKSFGLEEKKKGFFPHLYNTTENQNKKLLNLPDKEYYDPDSMSKERRQEFLSWWETNKDKGFDFQKEILEYCISDVDILLNSCWKFRALLRAETGTEEVVDNTEDGMFENVLLNAVDPFSFITIASVCMGIFRSKFLKETWAALTEDEGNLHPDCKHEWNCHCEWLKGRKVSGDSHLEVLFNGEWVPATNLKLMKSKFVNSYMGLIPPHGYGGGDNHSKESLEWLSLLEKSLKESGKQIEIQHARSPQGEKVVPYIGKTGVVRYKLDGYFENDGKQYACEFNGCSWHGCPSCFPLDRNMSMRGGKTLNQVYNETLLKEKRLQEMGYNVMTKWSCHFKKEVRQDKELEDFVLSLDIQDPIRIRDSYYGGRTDAIVLHKLFPEGEKGHYVDFTSLYPDILKYMPFPIGHPERYTRDFKEMKHIQCDGNCIYSGHCSGTHIKLPYFGIMKVTMLPPTDLLHPILPVRCDKNLTKDGKLKFPLCFKCADRANVKGGQCKCSDEERSFTETYCSPEIEVALNMGYQMLKVHEVLHWPKKEMYDTSNNEGGLFTQYINTFLKLKQQASDYPEDVKTYEDKEKYIDEYLAHEGILLDKELIQKNPGLRSISKLALNSFYGKFGQRSNLKRTKFVNDVGVLYNLFTDPSKEVTDFHIMNENICEIEFKHADDFEPLSVSTNLCIATFCTSWSRLKLWTVMHKLGKRVLYHDTDSVIFSTIEGKEQNPPLGKYLGELTDELGCKEVGCKLKECSGHYIKEFVSCGPKNYSFRLNTGQIVCKVRGFSLNHRSSLVLNFNSMKESLNAWMNDDKLDLVTVKTEINPKKILISITIIPIRGDQEAASRYQTNNPTMIKSPRATGIANLRA